MMSLRTGKMVMILAMGVVSSSRVIGVEAFTAAGRILPAGQRVTSMTLSTVPDRIVILPDSRAAVSDTDLWHHHLKEKLKMEKLNVSIEDMPDPYSFNTKRYESFWLGFMVDELALSPDTFVIAHGTAADALLRFAENHEVWGAVLVCPGGELYHAGERHGRPYVWSRVQRGFPRIAMVHGIEDPIVGDDEAARVRTELGIPNDLFRQVPGGQQRLRDHKGSLSAVEELVTSALDLSLPSAVVAVR